MYQNILCHIKFFFTLYKGYKCNNLLVICNNTKDNFLQEPEKINFKFHKNWEKTGKLIMRKISFCEIWGF